jgi:methyl-accepting chemotaxis protein/sigma-B regulation protein RsbU (phosphoserine phosphatase)
MTNQMIGPADAIVKSVTELCEHYHDNTRQEAAGNVDIIQQEGQVITDLLNSLIETAESEKGKEERV